MGRKILENLTKVHNEMPAPSPGASSLRKMGSAPSVGGLRDGLDRLSQNSVREIDTALIDQDGLQDRLAIDAESIVELAESIRQHGQQVPILVRPSADQPGRFRIVYGRRRLAAVRRIGGPIKASVRTLDDRASVVAQGQENNLRLDPSFIEKAVFVRAMRASGYGTDTIMDALGVSKQSVSTYEVVLPAIPMEVIVAIGAAHSIGRRKWSELAEIGRRGDVDLVGLLDGVSAGLAEADGSSARFELVLSTALAAIRPMQTTPPAKAVHRGGRTVALQIDGRQIAHLKPGPGSVGSEVSRSAAPEFGDWLAANAEEAMQLLHRKWQESLG